MAELRAIHSLRELPGLWRTLCFFVLMASASTVNLLRGNELPDILSNEEYENGIRLDQEALVSSAIRSRERIRRGSFRYKHTAVDPVTTIENVSMEGIYLFDKDEQRYLHAAIRHTKPPQSVHASQAGERERETIGIIRDGDHVRRAIIDAQWNMRLARPIPYDKRVHATVLHPFYFETFGHAYYGDVKVHSTPDEVFAGYLTWHDPVIIKDRRGEVVANFGTTVFRLNRDAGHWITNHRFTLQRQLRPGMFRDMAVSVCDVELSEVAGLQIPSKVTYKADKRESLRYELEWQSINKPSTLSDFAEDRLFTEILQLSSRETEDKKLD